MSKKAKLAAKEKRRHEKSKRKMANKARYEALAGTEANRKKKGGSSAGGSGIKWCRCHSDNCGNIGCKRCFPHLQRAF